MCWLHTLCTTHTCLIQEDSLDDVKLANSKEPSPKAEPSSKAEQQPEAKKPKKPKVQVISLPIESLVPGMSKSEIDLGIEREGKMAAQDKLEKERGDAKNTVEEYVYEMREKLDMQLQNFISEKVRDHLMCEIIAIGTCLHVCLSVCLSVC